MTALPLQPCESEKLGFRTPSSPEILDARRKAREARDSYVKRTTNAPWPSESSRGRWCLRHRPMLHAPPALRTPIGRCECPGIVDSDRDIDPVSVG